jgi:hypothetical protein
MRTGSSASSSRARRGVPEADRGVRENAGLAEVPGDRAERELGAVLEGDRAVRGERGSYKVGDEIFLTGKDTMIYFPRPGARDRQVRGAREAPRGGDPGRRGALRARPAERARSPGRGPCDVPAGSAPRGDRAAGLGPAERWRCGSRGTATRSSTTASWRRRSARRAPRPGLAAEAARSPAPKARRRARAIRRAPPGRRRRRLSSRATTSTATRTSRRRGRSCSTRASRGRWRSTCGRATRCWWSARQASAG